MGEANGSGPVDRTVGRDFVTEGLWYFERAGDAGDKQYVAAIRAELDRLRADRDALIALLRDVEANARRAWADRSLSAEAWPADLARRVTAALAPNAVFSGAGTNERDDGAK